MRNRLVAFVVMLMLCGSALAGVKIDDAKYGTWFDVGTVDGTIMVFDEDKILNERTFHLVTDGIVTRQDICEIKPVERDGAKSNDFSMLVTPEGNRYANGKLNTFLYENNQKKGFFSIQTAGLSPSCGGTILQRDYADRTIVGVWNMDGTRETRIFHIGEDSFPTNVCVLYFDENNKFIKGIEWQYTSFSKIVDLRELNMVARSGDTVEYVVPNGLGLPAYTTVIYTETDQVDTKSLLVAKLNYLRTVDVEINCATGMVFAASAMFDCQNVERLPSVINGQTSIRELRDCVAINLNAEAVEFNLALMAKDDVAIVRLPVKNHFVLLTQVTDDGGWVVDMVSKRFLVRLSREELESLFSMSHVAIVVSDEPITGFVAMAESQLDGIFAATPEPRDCNEYFQGLWVGECGDNPECQLPGSDADWIIIWLRYRCGAGVGICEDSWFVSITFGDCYEHPTYGCIADWSTSGSYWTQACK